MTPTWRCALAPDPPAALPSPAAGRAAAWQEKARFQRATDGLAHAVRDVVDGALEQWREMITTISALPGQARALLPPAGQLPPGQVAALARLDEAVAALPRPPASFPVTAADVAATGQAMAEFHAANQGVSDAMAAVLAAAADGWDERVDAARNRANAARLLLPRTGAQQAALEAALDAAEAAVPDRPALPLDTAGFMAAPRRALSRLAAFETATSAVLSAATALDGLQVDVAAHPALVAAARRVLPYTGSGPRTSGHSEPAWTRRLPGRSGSGQAGGGRAGRS